MTRAFLQTRAKVNAAAKNLGQSGYGSRYSDVKVPKSPCRGRTGQTTGRNIWNRDRWINHLSRRADWPASIRATALD